MDKDGGGSLDVKELTTALTDLALPTDAPVVAQTVLAFPNGIDVKQFNFKALV